MNKTKLEKGITLIALVITIIVLLILAGISISMLTGENGILNQATKAKDEDAHAKVREEIQLELINYEMEKGTGERSTSKIQYLAVKGYFKEEYSKETESYTIKTEKISNVSTGKGASKEAGDVYVVEKESAENNNWVLRYYKTSSDVKDLLAITETEEIDEEVEDEIMPQATIEQLQEKGYSVGKTPEGNILAADTQDDKVILYKYNSHGNYLSKENLKYTDSSVFDFDEETGKISIKSNMKSGQLGYYDEYEGINMGNLTELVIPKKIDGEEVKLVGLCNFTCNDLIGITRVIVPNTVTEISDDSFRNCSDIKIITLPDSITKIGRSAFKQTSLKNIVLPRKLLSLGSAAFQQCSMQEITIPYGITSISSSMFYNTDISYIQIPDSVTSIERSAFHLSGLKRIKIPKSVTEIGENAFFDCHELREVWIPSSVRSIGKDAFYGIASNSIIYVENDQVKQLLIASRYSESQIKVEPYPSED